MRPDFQSDFTQRFHLVAEPLAAEPLGVAPDGRRSKRRCIARGDRVGEGLGRRLVDEHPGLAVDDRFERAAAAERDDRPAARLRLERHDAEVLFAGQQHDRRAAVQVADRLRRTGGRGTDASPLGRDALERGALRAVADNLQRHAGQRAGVDGELDALVGDERRHDERDTARAATPSGRKNVGVDGRIHDGGLAIIVSADPARNIMRDSHIAVHAARRVAIPPGQPRHDRPHQPAAEPARSAPVRSRRRTGPRRSASASGSSRGAAPRPAPMTDFTQQWLMLRTRSNRSKSNCSTAAGKSGR